MKTFLNFLFYFSISFLGIVAVFLLILFGWALTDINNCKTAILDLFTPETILSFSVLVIAVTGIYLIYSTGKFVIAVQEKDKQGIGESVLSGVPMTIGIITMIYLLLL